MTIDYFPTFAQVAGAEVDVQTDGQSLVPLFRNPDATFDRSLHWHYPHYHAGGDGPYGAIRVGDYRLIEFFENDGIDRLRLYNLAADIGEKDDLSKTLPAVAEDLHHQLLRWRESVGAQMPTINPNHDPARATEVVNRRR
jgi:arylsulfatase A-like enzyme